MTVLRGRIVRTPTHAKAYKAVLEHADGPHTEHPIETMREGEALIKQWSPALPARDQSRDPPPSAKTQRS